MPISMLRNRLAAICGIVQTERPLQSFQIKKWNRGGKECRKHMKKWNIKNPASQKNSAVVQVSLILARGTKPTGWWNSIQRKVATRKANTVLCIIFTHTPFHYLRDHFISKDSLIPFLEPANGTANTKAIFETYHRTYFIWMRSFPDMATSRSEGSIMSRWFWTSVK